MQQPELGRKISEFRNDCGLTQEQLAEKTNINIRTIQRIESGEVAPRTFTLKVILDILGRDFSEVNGTTDTQININQTSLIMARNAGIILIACDFLYLAIVFLRDLYGIRSGIYHMNVIIFLTMIVSTFFFNRGFIHIGKSLDNLILVITGYVGIILTCFCDLTFLATFYTNSSILNLIAKGFLILCGINGIFYGVGLLLLKSYLNDLAILASITVIVVSALFIIPVGILGLVALILSIPSLLIQIFILFKLQQKQSNEIAVT